MTHQAKKRLFAGLSLLMVLAVIYCGLCILQAISIFTGDRVLRNLHFWGTLMCVAFPCALLFGVLAFRAGRLAKVGSRGAA